MKTKKIIHVDYDINNCTPCCPCCKNKLSCKYYIKHIELINLLIRNNLNSEIIMYDITFLEKLAKICNAFERKNL